MSDWNETGQTRSFGKRVYTIILSSARCKNIRRITFIIILYVYVYTVELKRVEIHNAYIIQHFFLNIK